MPPVMGATAFVVAEVMGVSYRSVALAALGTYAASAAGRPTSCFSLSPQVLLGTRLGGSSRRGAVLATMRRCDGSAGSVSAGQVKGAWATGINISSWIPSPLAWTPLVLAPSGACDRPVCGIIDPGDAPGR